MSAPFQKRIGTVRLAHCQALVAVGAAGPRPQLELRGPGHRDYAQGLVSVALGSLLRGLPPQRADPAQMALVGAGFLLLLHQLDTTRSGRWGRNCTMRIVLKPGRACAPAERREGEARTGRQRRVVRRTGPERPEETQRWSAASEADCGRATARAPCSALAHLDPLGSGRPWD